MSRRTVLLLARDGARRWIDRALEENPYDMHALEWRKYLAERAGDNELASRTQELISSFQRSAERPDWPVMLYFHPELPVFEPDTTLQVDGTKVFDHSKFGVTLQNLSHRAVEIESATLTSVGNAAASRLGDIKDYWRYPQGKHRLGAREHVYFEKQWGFTVDTGHRHVRYVFRTCWRGVGSGMRQCRTQWVDTLPYISNSN